jgi:TPR repeat protein
MRYFFFAISGLSCWVDDQSIGCSKITHQLQYDEVLEGLGTKQNLIEGIKWLRKAAFQGDAKAQYSLGMAYCDGEGVRKNIRYAQAWLGKAAQQGHKKASAKLLKIIRTK